MKAVVIKIWFCLEFDPKNSEQVHILHWSDSKESALENESKVASDKTYPIKSFCLGDRTEKIEDWFMAQGMDIFGAHHHVELVKKEIFNKLGLLNKPT